ncbi:MAG: hypothetical protein A2Y62_11885, partial [Candidatus Fischerbacteria bacterium RBG_13_37_8]
MTKARILIVENERIVAEDIKRTLLSLGYDPVGIAMNSADALRLAKEQQPDLVLMDIVLGGDDDGIQIAHWIRSRFGMPVIYLTAYADNKTLESVKVTEPFGYILKPFNELDLRTHIEIALYKHKIECRLKESQEELRVLFEYATDAILIHDLDGRLLNANRTACNRLGYIKEDLCQYNIRDVSCPEFSKLIVDFIDK